MATTPLSGTQNATLEATLDRLNTPSVLPNTGGLASLDAGDFLTLMTTQLQFQDPLEPASNEEMLAQMAQFTSLASNEESSATLQDISAKLDALIEAQRAAAEAAQAAAEAAAGNAGQGSANAGGTAPSAPRISVLS
ncbi:flagellar hook assembly protein FlgD [Erythrobacter sp. YT30]|uniref:flagellar hook assembly protein FlgD n=1 Tax=Erythrobacter sp. YT30 TaxID=1735012 RepID=UPI00076DCD4F|nr:flagellar hook capping FlgD N-terminal domain-containing protein [Erythrobacter sp. YT30]KWV91667.1 hypothetical protein AUC45_10670 [Erythrobacter sp. YT30]